MFLILKKSAERNKSPRDIFVNQFIELTFKIWNLLWTGEIDIHHLENENLLMCAMDPSDSNITKNWKL